MATNPIADDKERISVQFTKIQKREYTRLAQALNLDLSKYIRMIIEKYHEQGPNTSKEAITVQNLKNELLRNAANDCDYLRERLHRIKNSITQVLSGGVGYVDKVPDADWEDEASEQQEDDLEGQSIQGHPNPRIVDDTQ